MADHAMMPEAPAFRPGSGSLVADFLNHGQLYWVDELTTVTITKKLTERLAIKAFIRRIAKHSSGYRYIRKRNCGIRRFPFSGRWVISSL
jgi:hypothetical protein